MTNLLEEFDSLIEDAQVDFVGTGDVNQGWKDEKEWRERVKAFRERLSYAKFIEDSFRVRYGDSRP